jgi:5,10-methylenetetrahydromethanopterin reductase
MEFGIVLAGGGSSIEEMVELGKRAEQAVDSVYCVEAWRSALVPLAAIAQRTSSVKLGTFILNAYGRSPLLTAMSAIDLDELSGGRFVLGIGVGNHQINELYQGIPTKQPLRKMEEYVSIVRQMVEARPGETVSFEGTVHSVVEWPPAVKPLRSTIPIYLAAIHPAMRRVVGRVADGLALGSLCSPSYLAESIRPAVIEGAVSADRDPDALRYLVACLVSADEDREAARLAVRRAICRMFWPLPHPYYEFLLNEQGFGDAAAAALKHVPEGRIEQAMEAMSDELIDTVAVAGTPEECRRKLRRYEGLADEIILVNPGLPTTESSDRAAFLATYDTVMQCASAPAD